MFFLGLLNEAGKQAISSVVRQGSALYPPAASRLEDPCSNYSSLKGTDKWLLGSILLLVARLVLHDVTSLVRDHTVGTGVSAWGGGIFYFAEINDTRGKLFLHRPTGEESIHSRGVFEIFQFVIHPQMDAAVRLILDFQYLGNTRNEDAQIAMLSVLRDATKSTLK